MSEESDEIDASVKFAPLVDFISYYKQTPSMPCPPSAMTSIKSLFRAFIHLQEDHTALETSNSSLLASFSELNQSHTSLVASFDSLTHSHTDLTSKLQTLESLYSSSQLQLSSLLSDHKSSKSELSEKCTDLIKEMEEEIDERRKIELRWIACEEKYKDLKKVSDERNEKKKLEIMELEVKAKCLEEEIEIMGMKIAVLEGEKMAQMKEITQMRLEGAMRKKEVEEVKRKEADMKKGYESMIEELELKIVQLQKDKFFNDDHSVQTLHLIISRLEDLRTTALGPAALG